MRYLATIYGDESSFETLSPDDVQREIDAYWKFEADARAAGIVLEGHALQPTATATTIRVRDGERLVTDGPFAETKEQLGGYYMLECRDLDEAIEWAARIPGAANGSVEVRPLMEFEPPDDAATPDAAAGAAS